MKKKKRVAVITPSHEIQSLINVHYSPDIPYLESEVTTIIKTNERAINLNLLILDSLNWRFQTGKSHVSAVQAII